MAYRLGCKRIGGARGGGVRRRRVRPRGTRRALVVAGAPRTPRARGGGGARGRRLLSRTPSSFCGGVVRGGPRVGAGQLSRFFFFFPFPPKRPFFYPRAEFAV